MYTIEIIESLRGANLDRKFAERFKDLDQLEKAKDIVNQLWAPDSPFGTAEVLNTSWGSQLFRYVVEVNPIVCIDTLAHNYFSLDKEELAKLKEGRRELVWALEKLCFRNETFEKATKVLFKFAVSENENIANNATGQLKQLYQLFLSGTEATLESRMAILRWGLSFNDSDYERIVVMTLSRGIINGDYSRMMGAEKQGSGAPMVDNKPTWPEINMFRKEALDLLVQIGTNKGPNSAMAHKGIISGLRSLFTDGEVELAVESIKKITSCEDLDWENLTSTLRLIGSTQDGHSESVRNTITELLESFEPKLDEVERQLKLHVSLPTWRFYYKNPSTNWQDAQKENAENLAKDFVANNIDWTPFISTLLMNEQRQSYSFGNEIGRISSKAKKILLLAIEELKTIPKKEQNSAFIVGMLKSLDDQQLNHDVIEQFKKNENIRDQVFFLGRMLYSTYDEIESLFELVDDVRVSITSFNQFQYGRALDQLTNDEVNRLCLKISKFNYEGGWTALSLFFMYAYSDKEKWEAVKDTIRDIVLAYNLLSKDAPRNSLSFYHWSESVLSLLVGKKDDELAKVLSKYILEFCVEKSYNHSIEPEYRKVFRVLLDEYFDIVWPFIGEGLKADYLTFFHLEILIKARDSFGANDPYLFKSKDRCSIILEWCRENNGIAIERIANMMPLADSGAEGIEWHHFTLAIIDEFGEKKDVLSQLSSNMGTFGSVGSSVPYYESQLALVTKLENHKIDNVRSWVKDMISYTQRRIKLEKLNDESDMMQ